MKDDTRTVRILDQLPLEPIKGAVGLSGVLLLGETGVGKTTAVNYVAGIDYRQEKIQRKVALIPNKAEYFKTGHSTTSETRYPQLVKFSPSSVLVDLPGFEDTRGTIEEIAAATSIEMLTQQLDSIQAILMVCSWDNLIDSRMVSYRKVALSVGAIIQLNALTRENVILLVTKPPPDLERSEVRGRLQRLAEDEKWSFSPLMPVKRGEVSDDVWEKYCIRIGTEAILSRQDNGIIILDVTTPASREEFKQTLKLLEWKRKSPHLFDFGHYSRFMNAFQDEIDVLCESYNQKCREHVIFIDEVQKSQSTFRDLVLQVSYKEKENWDCSQLITTVFNDTEYVAYMAYLQQKIVELQQSRLVSGEQKDNWERDCGDAERRLAALECREEKSGSYEEIIKMKLSSSIFQESNFAIKPFKKYFEYDNKVQISRWEKKGVDQNILGEGLQFLKSLISFTGLQKAVVSSKFEGIIELTDGAAKIWKNKCNDIRGFYQSIKRFDEVPFELKYPLEFYSYCRDIPRYQGELRVFRQRIGNAESAVKESQNNIWCADDAIREQQRLLYETTEKLNHAKLLHAEKIEITKQKYHELSVEFRLLKSRLEAASVFEARSKEMLASLKIWFKEREVLFQKLFDVIQIIPSLKTDKTSIFSRTYAFHAKLQVMRADINRGASITHPENEANATDMQKTNVLRMG